MTLARPFSLVSLVAVGIMTMVGGCDSSASSKSSCQGDERCACYPNKTCNEGLVCLSKLCVKDDGGGGSGNAAGGTASDEGGASSVGSQSSIANGGTDPGTTIGQAGEPTTSTAQGGASVLGAGGVTMVGQGGTSMVVQGGATAFGQGGTTIVTGQGGTAVIGQGGTTVIGQGGTTVIGQGGTTVIGQGGTVANGGTSAALGGAAGTPILGANLVSNGDFSQGTAFWHVTYSSSDIATGSVSTDGAYCINYTSAGYYSQVIGWPVLAANATTLKASTTYLLSYRLMTTSSASVSSKIGLVASPYTAVYSTTSTSLTTSWKEARYTFATTSTQSTTAAYGIAFTVTFSTYGQVCIDDVILAEVTGYQ